MGKPSKVKTLEPVTEYIGYVEESLWTETS